MIEDRGGHFARRFQFTNEIGPLGDDRIFDNRKLAEFVFIATVVGQAVISLFDSFEIEPSSATTHME